MHLSSGSSAPTVPPTMKINPKSQPDLKTCAYGPGTYGYDQARVEIMRHCTSYLH